jgi:hypothetical protein
MSNVKAQISNEAQNPNNQKGNLTFSHLSLIWHLNFDIWIFVQGRIHAKF